MSDRREFLEKEIQQAERDKEECLKYIPESSFAKHLDVRILHLKSLLNEEDRSKRRKTVVEQSSRRQADESDSDFEGDEISNDASQDEANEVYNNADSNSEESTDNVRDNEQEQNHGSEILPESDFEGDEISNDASQDEANEVYNNADSDSEESTDNVRDSEQEQNHGSVTLRGRQSDDSDCEGDDISNDASQDDANDFHNNPDSDSEESTDNVRDSEQEQSPVSELRHAEDGIELSLHKPEGEYRDSDSDEDSVEDDLTVIEEIQNTQLLHIERRRLAMEFQGFNSSISQSKSTSDSNIVRKYTSFDPNEVKLCGRSYHKNRCYFLNIDSDNEKLVGILNFVSQDSARCILIAKMEDTFLEHTFPGHSSDDDDGGFLIDNFVRVHQQISEVKLSDLDDEKLNCLPKLIYEPQRKSNWCSFGYFLDWENFKVLKKRKEIRSLEFFAGCGGSLQAYHNHDFKTVMAIEKDNDAVRTLRANNEDIFVYHGCIRDFLNSYDTLKCALGKIDHIHFSPPCKGFSTANRNQVMTEKDKENNDLSLLIVDVLRKTSCDTAVFENVIGMWRQKSIEYVKKIVREVLKLNYQIRVCTLEACDFGDAQTRPRFFMFIAKYSIPIPDPPKRTHGIDVDLKPYAKVSDTIGHLLHQDNASIPNMDDVMTTKVNPGVHGLIQLNPNGLSPTIRSSSLQPLHYSKGLNRCISVREAAEIQSFPPNYTFHGSVVSQYRQVGNAIPGKLAAAVAQSIKNVLMYEYDSSNLHYPSTRY